MSTPANMMGVPPGTDPAEYARIMREQQAAGLLTDFATTAPTVQQPQGSNRGFYQAARVSPLSGLSKLAAAVLAKKSMDKSSTDQAQMYAKALQAFGGGNPQIPAAGQNTDANADQGATSTPAAASPGQQSSGSQPGQVLAPGSTRLNPLGQDPKALLRLYMTDPAKYLDQIKGTPEWQTTLASYGGNVTAAQHALQAKLIKEGSISNRSGEENMIPDGHGGYNSIRTPNLGTNQDYTRDPVTHQIIETHLIPGALTAEASQRGAETAATQANTPREVPIGGGATRLMYPGQVPGLGAPPGASAQTPSATGTATGQTAAPTRQYFPQSPAAPAPAQAATSATQLMPTKAKDGVTFDNNLPANLPKMKIPSTPGQTSDAYTQAIVSSAAKKHQELVDKLGEGSAQAALSNNYLDQALKDLPQAETGPMSEWLTEHRGKLLEMAPSLGPLLGGTGTVTPTLELNKALVNSGLQGAKANFGRLTQSEVMLQKDEMSPSAKMTHDAIAALIHQQQIKNGYAIQQDKDYGEYHAAGGDPNRFESQYTVKRPITRFAAQYDTPQQALDRLKQRPDALPDFKKKYGWDPTQ